MTNGMKMLLLSNKPEKTSRKNYGENNYGENNYGRYNGDHHEDYDRINNPYNRMGENRNAYNSYEMPENRRYKNGRYAPKNGGYEYESDKEWEDSEMHYDGMTYGEYKPQQMQMGFAVGENDGNRMPFSRLAAEKWMKEIENEDGTKGAHWTLEQAKQIMAQKSVKGDPISFWVVLNSMYADYSKTIKKYGVGDKIDFYVDLTKDFLNDKDSVGGDAKVAAYFEHIVRL